MKESKHLFGRRWRLCAALAIVCLLAAAPPAAVRAADDGDDAGAKAAPRTVVKIGGVSVVLISANDQLYAFVDRLADNAPADDARIVVTPSSPATKLDMRQAAAGLFVAPFVRTGHLRDTFKIEVNAADGSGQQTAEIIYDDVPARAADRVSSGVEVFIAVVAGALGAALALAIVWYRQPRRREDAGANARVV